MRVAGFNSNSNNAKIRSSSITLKKNERMKSCFALYVGRGSSARIATGYGLGGPGNESGWGRDFSHPSRPALGPTQALVE
jgi:hypothetical protein